MIEPREDGLTMAQMPTCPNCSAEIDGNPMYCVSCGFPLNGTEKEKSKFYAEQAMTKSKVKDAPKKIRQARNTLFIVGGLQLLFGIVVYFMADATEELIAGAVLFLIYLGLGFWSQKKPLIALILGLLLYLSLIILSAVVDPTTITSGVLVKVIIIVFLGKGINSARELKKQEQQQ